MAKVREYVPLRDWTIDKSSMLPMPTMKKCFEEYITAAGYGFGVIDAETDDGKEAIAICSLADSSYMKVYLYYVDGCIEMSVVGKGKYVHATDLKTMYQKVAGTAFSVRAAYNYSLSKGRKFTTIGAGYKLAAATGAVTGAAIRGGVHIAAKGIRALTRDKDAYEKEMRFYTLALSLGDYIVGGVNAEGIVDKIKKNADSGMALAQYFIGYAFQNGIGAEQSNSTAVKYFAMAAASGEQRSRQILAYEYLHGDTEYSVDEKYSGLEYLKEIADGGDAEAIKDILDIHSTGKISGIPADAEKTIDLAYEYGNNGSVYACAMLANLYDSSVDGGSFGFDVAGYKNDSLALKVYEILLQHNSDQYNETAAMKLASMYKDGRGTEKDRAKELQYYELASKCGNVSAKKELIYAYTLGLGVDKDYAKAGKVAKELYALADKSGVAAANYCSYKISDDEKKYKLSMDYARKYLASEKTEPDKRKEVEEYLAYQEDLISKMTVEERCEYLGERKPLSPQTKKILLIGSVVVVALIILFAIIGGGSSNSGQSNTSTTVSDSVLDDDPYLRDIDYSQYKSDFIFYDSSDRYLQEDEVRDLSDDDIQMAINEIYARHGRIFADEPYYSHFNSCAWFEPTYTGTEFDDSLFNDIEKSNIDLIASVRNQYGFTIGMIGKTFEYVNNTLGSLYYLQTFEGAYTYTTKDIKDQPATDYPEHSLYYSFEITNYGEDSEGATNDAKCLSVTGYPFDVLGIENGCTVYELADILNADFDESSIYVSDEGMDEYGAYMTFEQDSNEYIMYVTFNSDDIVTNVLIKQYDL